MTHIVSALEYESIAFRSLRVREFREIVDTLSRASSNVALHGRVDLAKYQVGLATCLNWVIHPFGGASTRAGTAFVGAVVDAASRSRLIPFAFNTEQTYVLEFGDQKMRVVKEGGYVLEGVVTIAGISLANPGVVTTSGAHGYSTGDRVFLDGIAGMTALNRRTVTVIAIGASTFSIGLDTSGYGAWTAGGTAAAPRLERGIPRGRDPEAKEKTAAVTRRPRAPSRAASGGRSRRRRRRRPGPRRRARRRRGSPRGG